MDFFGIGSLELILILIVLLIFVGPARLPGLVGAIGRGVRKLKEATTELSKDFEEMAEEVKDGGKEVSSAVRPAAGLTGELRDVTKEMVDVRKEINTALKSDAGLTRDLKKVSTESENVAKVTSTASKPAPEEEAAAQKEEGKVEEQG